MTDNTVADIAAYTALGLAALLTIAAICFLAAWVYARAANHPHIDHLPERQPFLDALQAHREGHDL